MQQHEMVPASGGAFVWRFATAFRLVDYVADGNESAAVAFLDWLRAEGFNGARVLSTLCCWFELAPVDGQRALPRTLQLAAERGLYLEVVGLAGTREGQRSLDEIQQHVAAIGSICAAHANCAAIELANENAHPTQRSELTDQALLERLRDAIPAVVPVSTGSNCCGQVDRAEPYPGGGYITIHSDRSGTPWERLQRMHAQHLLSKAQQKFVVDDEAIGAGESEEGGRRSTNESEFFARGALARLFGIGATFHFSDGLQAVPPKGRQAAAARAFIAGTRIVPDDVDLVLHDVGAAGSPVAAFAGAAAVYVGSGSTSVAVALDVKPEFSLQMNAPWRIGRTIADRSGVKVLEIARNAH